MPNQRAYLYILFSFFVVLSSWIRWYSTGTLKADDNFIDQSNLALWLCVILYHVGIYGMIYTLYNIASNKPHYKITKKQTIIISIASMLLFSGMTVMFASDIYTYLAEGELATRGILSYTNGELVRQSKYIDYVSHWWKDCPNHYGSPLLFLFGFSCFIGQSIYKSYLVFKVLIFFVGILLLRLVSKLENREGQNEYNYFAIMALSPVLMIEGIGQVHAEIVITLLLAATMLSMQKKNIYLAALFIGTAIACKILYGIILLPLFMALLFVSSKDEKHRWSYLVKTGLICLGILLATVVILYWPIWEGWATITNPMAYHSTKTPSRSYTEIFILVYRYGSEILTNGTTIPELIKLAQSPDFFPISQVIALKNKIAPFFAGLGLVLAILNLIPVFAIKKTEDVYYYFAKLWIIIIVIYSPIFNPWYFMPIILLMIYHQKSSWIFYLIFITSISMNYQIGNSIPLDSLLNLLVTINMVLMLIMFLYKFKFHFIKEPLNEIRGMIDQFQRKAQ